MKKKLDMRNSLLKGTVILALALALICGVFSANTIVGHAESQGKITAASVNIRKEPSTSSETIGSTERDKTVSVISQVKGADGYNWYKVYVNANTTGYIRSDLMTITDGTTPPSDGTTATPPPSNEPPASTDVPQAPPVEVTDVNPVSGSVTGDSVKIYDNASTSAGEVSVVQNGTALTITGQATDPEGTAWYRVSFISNDAQVAGFVQAVYVHPSGDLTPITNEPPQEATPTPTPVPEKQYDTVYVNGEWQLFNIDDPTNGYSIKSLLEANSSNQEFYEGIQKTVKNQKIIIIILVFLLVAAVAGIAFLVFKVRDMMDSAYFNEVENETLRRRSARGEQEGGQRTMHTVGAPRQEGRPSGARQSGGTAQRPAGSSQSQRPGGAVQGQRPAGAPQSQRPAGASQSQRPAGAPQGQRPAGAVQGQRPAGTGQGQRPIGTSQVQRPAGASQRPGSPSQSQRPAGVPQGARPSQGGGQKPQPKNFIADDEEFEFEFLNYDGDDVQ